MTGLELRIESGRTVAGVAVTYDDTATPGAFSERFEPGSITFDDVMLNVQHDRKAMLARTPRTLRLTDGPRRLEIRADLPRTQLGDDVLELVRAGVLQGLSLGFVALRDRWDGDDRIIESAILDHVAIVDRPAYGSSVVEARTVHRRYWRGADMGMTNPPVQGAGRVWL